MTPVERLRAAIEKLEQLKAESTPGDWLTKQTGIDGEMEEQRHLARAVRIHAVVVDDGISPIDAQLIVTLHRTIDAQLGILRDALNCFVELFPPGPFTTRAVALADAILGETP